MPYMIITELTPLLQNTVFAGKERTPLDMREENIVILFEERLDAKVT